MNLSKHQLIATVWVLSLSLVAGGISATCVNIKGDCCLECKAGYNLAKCECYQQGKYIMFLVNMTEFWYLTWFIFIPVGLAVVVYLVFIYKEVNELKQRAKTERSLPPVILSNHVDYKASEPLKKQRSSETLEVDAS